VRRIVAILLILAMSASTASAQSIGVYADPLGTDCNLVIPYPGPPVALYVVGNLDGIWTEGVTSAKFRIAGLPAGWGTSITPDPSSNVVLGSLFGDGVAIAYPICFDTSPVVLFTVVVTPTSDAQNVNLSVETSLQFPNCGLDGGNCGLPCPMFCGCIGFDTPCLCAETPVARINGPHCVVALEPNAWGRVKNLYR
jgi:hypothetical protein